MSNLSYCHFRRSSPNKDNSDISIRWSEGVRTNGYVHQLENLFFSTKGPIQLTTAFDEPNLSAAVTALGNTETFFVNGFLRHMFPESSPLEFVTGVGALNLVNILRFIWCTKELGVTFDLERWEVHEGFRSTSNNGGMECVLTFPRAALDALFMDKPFGDCDFVSMSAVLLYRALRRMMEKFACENDVEVSMTLVEDLREEGVN